MPTIKGKIRGYGRQLGDYLVETEKNEWVEILDVDGQQQPDAQSLKNLLTDFSLMENLTKSKQGVYHLSINPKPEDAAKFTKDDWLNMAETLAQETEFGGQRRASVLHKNLQGRIHLHVAIERYSHEKQKMIPIDHNYRKHLKAGRKIAEQFNLTVLPERNERRPVIKETLTQLWHESANGAAFLQKAKTAGYTISKGYDKTPYMVVDETGRSHKLFSHLKGIKRKEVRERLKGIVLMEEKEAIAFMRTQQAITQKQQKQEAPDAQAEYLKQISQMRQRQKLRPRIS